MLLLIAAALAVEPECRQINLAQDDAHAVERRGWKDGKPPVREAFDAGPIFGNIQVNPPPHAPDVAATDRAITIATKEYAPLIVDARRGTGCLSLGDVRAFEWAYQNAELPDPFLMIAVNGKIIGNESGAMLFPARATDFYVNGLRVGDVVNVLVVAAGFQTVPRCHGIPTMGDPVGTEIVCDQGYMLWERREYVY